MSEPKSPEVHIALNLLEELGDEDPALRQQLRRLLPALAQDYARAGKPVSERTLRAQLREAFARDQELRTLFHYPLPRQRRGRTRYEQVAAKLNKRLSPAHLWTIEDAVRFGDVGAVEAQFFQEPTEEFILRHIKAAAYNGHSDIVHFFIRHSVDPKTVIAQALHAAYLFDSAPQHHIRYEIERDYAHAYTPEIQTAIQTNTKKDQRRLYDDYVRLRAELPMFDIYPADHFHDLQKWKNFDVRMKDYLSVRAMLSYEIGSLHVRNNTAFKALIVFQTAGRVLSYLQRWGKTPSERPLTNLLSAIAAPMSKETDWPAWGNALLRFGPALAPFVHFADAVVRPEVNDFNRPSLRLTRQKIWHTCFPRKEENPALAELCLSFARSNTVFETALDVWKKRATSAASPSRGIPDIAIGGDSFGLPGYTLRKIDDDDLRIFFLGDYDGCCERVGHMFEDTIFDAIKTRQSSFYVLTDRDDNIVLHSWTWRGKGGQLVIDGYESRSEIITNDNLQRMTREIAYALSAYEYRHFEITDIILGRSGEQFRPHVYFPEAQQHAERYIHNHLWHGEYSTQWLVRRLAPPTSYELPEEPGAPQPSYP